MSRTTTKSTLVACLALSLLALACAGGKAESKPSVEQLRLTKADMKYRAIHVEPFTIAPAGVKEKEPAPHVDKAKNTCVQQLSASGLFETVDATAADAKQPGLIVKAELTSLRIVGGGARFWLGAMAGKSDMRFNVTVLDGETGAVVGKSEIGNDTNPFGGAWTMGGTDKSLPGNVGERLAEYVVFAAKK